MDDFEKCEKGAEFYNESPLLPISFTSGSTCTSTPVKKRKDVLVQTHLRFSRNTNMLINKVL